MLNLFFYGRSEEINNFLNKTPVPSEVSIEGAVLTGEERVLNHPLPVYHSLEQVDFNKDNILLVTNHHLEENYKNINYEGAELLFTLMISKEQTYKEYKKNNEKLMKIINATHDGMIAIDEKSRLVLINKRAAEMTELSVENSLGRNIEEVMPTSRLPRVLNTNITEYNKKQIIGNDRSIITTRVPMYEEGNIIGALAVFRDVTEIVKMAEEVTNLKSIRTMLESIINSSDDAISVVNEKGIGLLINPAYTRLTGLSEKEVVGKPAATDISEGESIHMRVLQTKKPIRGARMKVGPLRRDVVVNAAPVIVDGKIKGSVGVVHDVSEMESLALELEQAKSIIRTLEAKYEFADIIGNSTEIKMAVEQAKVAAKTPAAILLRGESGTGKELFAHAVHNESKRKFNKFIRVNCASLTETLLESELFGYEEGAFSGAKRGGKKGLFEEADKGSIFLDEIGELSPKMQAKLLRVLQEHEIVRVGGTAAINVDVRLIAATNINIEKKIEESQFRADLFFRLNRVPIFIPSLRERKQDIPILAMHLLRRLNQDYGRYVNGLTEEAALKLQSYHWPGNVRELENVLGRAVIHMPQTAQKIHASHITIAEETKPAFQNSETFDSRTLEEQLNWFEKNLIQQQLIKNDGNKTQTAKKLNISLRNLYYKMEKFSL
ncbi:sigma-54 interaction domain-containing protein [Alkalicoccus daliensis]|uniref:PAS domain S-box-containing protein n=1 Tax=Alkalicoccus daliensis TaxID=745820 RepID=A0A1H0B3Q4_9BACI|nr:sigma-54-dependent Fis family transcriptional regulator [Alkalicoccus daliensis]SDN40232.1 PAS domain S-box-containing protein [Alkalicoccus daliensis]